MLSYLKNKKAKSRFISGKKIILTLTSCLFSFFLYAQNIQWQNTIGGSDRDQLLSISQTSDGGYICGGLSYSNISGDKVENNWDTTLTSPDYWVVKLDAQGNIQWQNTIGGNAPDYLYSIFQTADGGYICGGSSYSYMSGDKTEISMGLDYWVIKLDAQGNIQWQNTIGGYDYDWLYSISQTADGGYICGGHSNSNISADKTENSLGAYDYWIVKLDASGNIQWQNTIGGNNHDQMHSISQTTDGGYICEGWSGSNMSGDKAENSLGLDDYWVIKLDASGNIQWQNTIGGSDEDQLYSIGQTADGGYICGGYSLSNISGDKTEDCFGGDDYWVVKLDASGNIQWQNTIGGSNYDQLYSIGQTADGGYICGGYSLSNISGDKTEDCFGGDDYWVVKLDASGNIQWQNTIGGSSADRLSSIAQTIDGGYFCGGFSSSNISGDKTEPNWDTICNPICTYDYWVVKLFPDSATGIFNLQQQTSNFQIFPNPVKDELTVSSKQLAINKIEIVNLLGKTVSIQQPGTLNQQPATTIDVSSLAPGVYIIEIYSENKIYRNKVVKE